MNIYYLNTYNYIIIILLFYHNYYTYRIIDETMIMIKLKTPQTDAERDNARPPEASGWTNTQLHMKNHGRIFSTSRYLMHCNT